ncbi:MAG: hypothetical protein ACREQL_06615 [Candidatus Binatia bacterium]
MDDQPAHLPRGRRWRRRGGCDERAQHQRREEGVARRADYIGPTAVRRLGAEERRLRAGKCRGIECRSRERDRHHGVLEPRRIGSVDLLPDEPRPQGLNGRGEDVGLRLPGERDQDLGRDVDRGLRQDPEGAVGGLRTREVGDRLADGGCVGGAGGLERVQRVRGIERIALVARLGAEAAVGILSGEELGERRGNVPAQRGERSDPAGEVFGGIVGLGGDSVGERGRRRRELAQRGQGFGARLEGGRELDTFAQHGAIGLRLLSQPGNAGVDRRRIGRESRCRSQPYAYSQPEGGSHHAP